MSTVERTFGESLLSRVTRSVAARVWPAAERAERRAVDKVGSVLEAKGWPGRGFLDSIFEPSYEQLTSMYLKDGMTISEYLDHSREITGAEKEVLTAVRSGMKSVFGEVETDEHIRASVFLRVVHARRVLTEYLSLLQYKLWKADVPNFCFRRVEDPNWVDSRFRFVLEVLPSSQVLGVVCSAAASLEINGSDGGRGSLEAAKLMVAEHLPRFLDASK